MLTGPFIPILISVVSLALAVIGGILAALTGRAMADEQLCTKKMQDATKKFETLQQLNFNQGNFEKFLNHLQIQFEQIKRENTHYFEKSILTFKVSFNRT